MKYNYDYSLDVRRPDIVLEVWNLAGEGGDERLWSRGYRKVGRYWYRDGFAVGRR
jgi:hypothetical protein